MRARIGSIGLGLALFGSVAFGESNPAAGIWKLDRQKSTVNGPVPAMVHNGVLKVRPEIFTGSDTPAPERQAARTARDTVRPPVFLFNVSADGRTLTVTRPNDPATKMIFERQ